MPTKRDKMTRCKICKKLYNDSECDFDPVKGFICPKGCEEPFNQPPYESPMQDE